MKILICADTVPTPSNYKLFSSGNGEELVGSALFAVFQNADFRIINLEVPLTDISQPIPKCGPNLIAPTSTIAALENLHIDLFSLANNHILDQGELGLTSTIDTLKSKNLSFLGAGKNIEEASRPHIIEHQGVRIGIYSCCEHEFTIATEKSGGANPYDPLTTFDAIARLKDQCDHVIVLYHGGKEHYRYPSPKLQKRCRKMVEKGASLVVCQHSHCIGCEEKYISGNIVYGQGNFIFDYDESEFWKTSLLLQCEITQDKFDVLYIPIIKESYRVRLADAMQSNEIMLAFCERSQEIISQNFIQKKYEEFSQEYFRQYMMAFWGIVNCRPIRLLLRIAKNIPLKWMYSRKNLLVMQNFLDCEAHHELFLTAVKFKNNGK